MRGTLLRELPRETSVHRLWAGTKLVAVTLLGGTADTRGARAPAAAAKAAAISRWLSAGPVGACHTVFHSVRSFAATIMAAARSGTYVKECGSPALPITIRDLPATTGFTMRSPACELRTLGPKKSLATTLAVSVADAARAFSRSVRTPRLPPRASRGPSSVIGRSGSL